MGKEFDKKMNEFVTQLSKAGVTKKTICRVLKEIDNYQKKEMIKQIKSAFDDMRKKVMSNDFE